MRKENNLFIFQNVILELSALICEVLNAQFNTTQYIVRLHSLLVFWRIKGESGTTLGLSMALEAITGTKVNSNAL